MNPITLEVLRNERLKIIGELRLVERLMSNQYSGKITNKRGVKEKNNINEILRQCKELIKDSDEPLNRTQIVEGLLSKNIEINAANKESYVGTLLWRNANTFEQVKGAGYKIKENK